MNAAVTIRDAQQGDVPAILDIYNDAVIHTTASYDLAPVSLESRLDWFNHKGQGGWPVLVAELGTEVVGWATFGPFREKEGYKHTVEHSVYVRNGQRGGGIGLALMKALIAEAKRRQLHVMIGGIDADNAGSIAFHKRLGFEDGAHLRQVGHKFDRWLNLVFMPLYLDEN